MMGEPTLRQVRDAMRFLDAAIDDVADRITAWAEQIVLNLHEPVGLEDEHGRPTGEVLCSAHRQRTDWPCSDVQRVTDARAARLRAQENAPPHHRFGVWRGSPRRTTGGGAGRGGRR